MVRLAIYHAKLNLPFGSAMVAKGKVPRVGDRDVMEKKEVRKDGNRNIGINSQRSGISKERINRD